MLDGMKMAKAALAEYYVENAPVMVAIESAITQAENLESAMACEIEAEIFETHVLPAFRRLVTSGANVDKLRRLSADASLSLDEAIRGVIDLYPGADKQALQCLGELLTKTPNAEMVGREAVRDD